jgi:hypothetical protein
MMLTGEANCYTYDRVLKELSKHFKPVWPHKNPAEMLLQHDNVRPHTSLKTLEAITKLGGVV